MRFTLDKVFISLKNEELTGVPNPSSCEYLIPSGNRTRWNFCFCSTTLRTNQNYTHWSSCSTKTDEASALSEGMSHRNSSDCEAPIAGTTYRVTSAGRIPAHVLVSDRASVTAGLAKDVDDVNKYAAVMLVPPRKGQRRAGVRTHPRSRVARTWRCTR